jgi:uncharacterized membrane protein YfcA
LNWPTSVDRQTRSNSSTAPHVLSQHRRNIRVWPSGENFLFINKFSILVGLLAEFFKGGGPPMVPGLFNALVLDWVSPKCNTLMQTAVG